jgi:hypothetical protein
VKLTPRRKFTAILLILFLLAVCVLGFRCFLKYKYEHGRARWKDATLKRLSLLSVTNEEISQELSMLKSSKPGMDLGWAGDNVLLMTNGEYVIYAFRHGFNDGFVNHLLLGHGSDGRWLYSTYHFHAPIEGSSDPPGSINEFCKRYSAREFDGISDVCLEKTWPMNR